MKPVNWFIIVKQKNKIKWEWKISYADDNELCENEFEVIDFDWTSDIISKWDTIVKWLYSWDKITIDWKEFYMIKPEHILWVIKKSDIV